MLELNRIYDIDCIEGMMQMDDWSVDLILCDLPWEMTQNAWDTRINMTDLWQQYRRILKQGGVIVLFGYGLFTVDLIQAGRDLYKYSLVWEKGNATGFLNANKMPLRAHEDLAVFYKRCATYNPQMTEGPDKTDIHQKHNDGTNYKRTKEVITGGTTARHPRTVLRFASDKQTSNIHPTQKPLALLRWVIRTYTNPGDVVLDNACGSGSTLVAADMEGRNWIGFDNGTCQSKKKRLNGRRWASIATERVETYRQGGKM